MASFTVTWDYRCPFARNAHEHVVVALEAGAPWDVTFAAFSLSQMHVEEGEPDVWEAADKRPALIAIETGIVVRDRFPERFPDVHLALFGARFDEGRDIREEAVLRDVVTAQGLNADEVFAEIDDGWPLETFRKEHEQLVESSRAFGVPTFITGGEAVFVRLMHRPEGDAGVARSTVERVLELLTGWTDLNELKRTTIPR